MAEEITQIQLDQEIVQDIEDNGAQHACLEIKRSLPDWRLDKYLKHRFPNFSRAVIQRLVDEEAVTVNDRRTKNSYQLKAGDRVDLILPPPPTREIAPEPIPLDVLYEDEHILAVNKQANLVVHPARGNRGGTLVNGLVHYSNSLSTVNGDFRPGIVHRLDRNTTGVMLVAKTDTAHWRLAHQFEHRQTQKTYLGVVHGTLDLDADVIDMPLGKHPHTREKYAARPESGKEAVTMYQLQKQYRGYAVVLLKPKTGRTHQLRVHMSFIKHPIVADIMYGGKTVTWAQLTDGAAAEGSEEGAGGFGLEGVVMDRQALHASTIQFRHPVSGEEMVIEAPLAGDMRRFIELLEQYRHL